MASQKSRQARRILNMKNGVGGFTYVKSSKLWNNKNDIVWADKRKY